MKSRIVFLLAAVAVAATAQYYDSSLDNIPVDQIIDSPRVLKNYGRCFLRQGPCTKEGTQIRRIMKDAMETRCAKCSPKQIYLIRQMDDAMMKHQPALRTQILNKYDPSGNLRDPFRQYILANS